jgi:hypothetical protein
MKKESFVNCVFKPATDSQIQEADVMQLKGHYALNCSGEDLEPSESPRLQSPPNLGISTTLYACILNLNTLGSSLCLFRHCIKLEV